MYKICFLAPSGYGKSTAVSILRKYFNLVNIKIAEPLYYLQNYFYKYIETKMLGEQDGELLQFLGMKIRKENPGFLINNFIYKVMNVTDVEMITNDDCRPPDYNSLKQMGYIFIGINGFDRDRYDHCKSNPKLSIEWQNKPECEYWLDNFGTMEEYESNILDLIYKILKDKGYNVCRKN